MLKAKTLFVWKKITAENKILASKKRVVQSISEIFRKTTNMKISSVRTSNILKLPLSQIINSNEDKAKSITSNHTAYSNPVNTKKPSGQVIEAHRRPSPDISE